MHCPNASAIYQECPLGYYTSVDGEAECTVCPAGAYCVPVTPATADDTNLPCPQGHYCLQGTGLDYTKCPLGTYSNMTSLKTASECLPCPAGQFCGSPGITAPSGTVQQPSVIVFCYSSHDRNGVIWPHVLLFLSPFTGYYCTSGVDRPNPSVTNETVNCTCPEQSYFTGAGGICPNGSYCPEGSELPTPCEPGTYSDELGLSVCKTCMEGHYCLLEADNFVSTPCPLGHYCPNGTQAATQYPCPPGTFNNRTHATSMSECVACTGGSYCEGYANPLPTGLCMAGWYCTSAAERSNDTNNGGECQPGYYCPEGSMSPIACPGGEYCQFAGLEVPTGLCSPGYYCVSHSTTGTPDGSDLTEGFYCPEGSDWPLPCPQGTYSDQTGLHNMSDCFLCDGGEYCAAFNMTSTSGNCTRGFYCTGAETVDNANRCPIGYYCPERTTTPILCPSGTYQDEEEKWSCKECPLGYYCDNSLGVVEINDTILCPPGSFCPAGTTYSTEFLCPRGTFSNATGLSDDTQCSPCSPGYYCGVAGSTSPTALCDPGYYCQENATTSTPNQGAEADVCPQGYFCPVGTSVPEPCVPGTYGDAAGLSNVSQCTPCTAGQFCEQYQLSAPEGDCTAGFYCPEGSDLRTKLVCPVGHYCLSGSVIPSPCPPSTYNPSEGLNTTDCLSCTPGYYCGEPGLNDTSALCDEGYYCPPGQNVSNPSDYPCFEGHSCPTGSSYPTQCSFGTFTNTTGQSVCSICPEGWYCSGGFIIAPCPQGYYCPNGTEDNWQECPPWHLQ
ncbi:hypothetical protein EB796_004987 [Bugula neritina]|uniref:Tyrosine-protein kinase ephrin type A/B receptor-like domain-containing protein n=1 Tax=Bugula neritina TaxID=10212 RepID=A0A7J7KEQ2_BUGNE|nr:hypothetical protein EB796_004987 [Bugula neritina]